jgi:hypothetical protein
MGGNTMNVWIRLYSVVTGGAGDDCLTLAVASKLYIMVHRTEGAARTAAAKLGGVVLEVVASSLKGSSEFNDVCLSESDNETHAGVMCEDEGKADSNAYISVACDDIPYKKVFQSLVTAEISDQPPANTQDDDDNPYQDLMDFTPEGRAYLDALEKEMDTSFHQ